MYVLVIMIINSLEKSVSFVSAWRPFHHSLNFRLNVSEEGDAVLCYTNLPLGTNANFQAKCACLSRNASLQFQDRTMSRLCKPQNHYRIRLPIIFDFLALTRCGLFTC